MFVPSAKSKLSLLVLMLASIILFVWVENSRIFVSDQYFEEKLAAASLMQKTEKIIKQNRLKNNVFIDDLNDPNKTALIGEKQSLIVTDRGDLDSKLTSLNPNFAAAFVQIFKEANLKKNDRIAVNCTGSLPAMNLAVLSAAEILELDVVLISSVGASMFGATDPNFTWLDMEKLLNENGVLSYRSKAASIGGGRDLGRGLNIVGRELIVENIQKNEVELVQEGSLEQNISKKMELFEQNGEIDLYVNVGGGLSSLGISINGQLIKTGFHRYLTLTNTPLKGTMLLFADKGVPIVHILDIDKFAENLKFPIAPVPLPKPGKGSMFEIEKYNVTMAAIAFIILVLLILIVIFFDHKELRLKEEEITL